MAAAAVFADLFLKAGTFIGMEGPSEETFADIIDRLLRRMAHVFRIETVVAQLVHHYFVGWEVVGEVERIHAQVGRESGKKIVDAEQKGLLADLISMSPVLEMADRTDGEDELLGTYSG